jgi:hypothetical protein
VDLEDLRLAVYEGFAAQGRAPSTGALAERLGAPPAQVLDGLRELGHRRHLALADLSPADDEGSRAGDVQVLMAHPFSAVPLGFSVMGSRTLWWGGCAWDSFALPHVVPGERQVLVATTCPACGAAHAWPVDDEQPPQGDQVAHFLVPAARMWDDVVLTCRHQRIFCSGGCVERWLRETGNADGYVMDLATLWRLAAHWYDGRLDRGYVRREPAAAGEYLHSVGLTGPFWGT